MEGFKHNDMASVKVEDDGVPHTINQRKKLLQSEARLEGAEDERQAMAKSS